MTRIVAGSAVTSANDVIEALQKDDLEGLETLLQGHPDKARGRGPNGVTVLQLAAYMRRDAAVRVLLDHDALTTVHEAAILGDVAAIDRFLETGPDALDAPGPDGFTPLHLAAHFGRVEALERLLDHGADLAAVSTNANRNTPLHAAAAGGSLMGAKVLIASGADVDARDAAGHAAIHLAAAAGHVPLIRALLDGGADPVPKNIGGKTPLDFARDAGREEAVAVLEQAAKDAQVA